MIIWPLRGSEGNSFSTTNCPGLPYFLEEPEDKAVPANTPFNLSCQAQGPPDPVNLLWLQDAVPLVPITGHSSQHRLQAPGESKSGDQSRGLRALYSLWLTTCP